MVTYPTTVKRRLQKGFTLIETMVATAVLGMFFAAIAFILQQVLENIGESRVRTTALALAQSKMEIVRNLPYDQVGTSGGIPSGALMQNESVSINNLVFNVNTSIIYVDDPFDGETPADLINTDYKRARIEVTWSGTFPSRVPVTLVTNIVPKGVEAVAGGGTLFIQVYNANGVPVSGATISIINTSVTPQINTQTLTNTNGLVVLPGSPACVTCYQISVTKSNHSTDRTYSTSEVANPLQPHATVIEGEITQVSFAIDSVSQVTINSLGSRQSGYPPVSNVFFTLKGSKIIGYTSQDDPVYKYQYSTNTGGGTVVVSSLEWDTYTIDLTNSAHNLAGSNPAVPFALAPATNLTVPIVTVPKSNTSLLLILKNSTQQLVGTGSAQLTNLGLSYDATISAGATGSADMGQAFFGGLTPGNYDLKVTAEGYQEATASVAINAITQETVTLNATQ